MNKLTQKEKRLNLFLFGLIVIFILVIIILLCIDGGPAILHSNTTFWYQND